MEHSHMAWHMNAWQSAHCHAFWRLRVCVTVNILRILRIRQTSASIVGSAWRIPENKDCRLPSCGADDIAVRLWDLEALPAINPSSNLARSGIANRCCHMVNHKSFFSLVGSNCMYWMGVRPQDPPFPWGSGTPSNTMCHWTPHVYLPNGI